MGSLFEDGFLWWAFAIIGLAMVFLGVAAYWESKRKKAVRDWALRQGYHYSDVQDEVTVQKLDVFEVFTRGSNRFMQPVIRGEFEDLPFMLFDYHYETYTQTKNGRQTHHHWCTYAVFDLGVFFPYSLRVRPENFFDRLSSMVGFSDINFESHEFSKTFHVSCSDRKFAFDVIHGRTMEFLLQHRKLSWALSGSYLLLSAQNGRANPEMMEYYLAVGRGIVRLLPDYLIDAHD